MMRIGILLLSVIATWVWASPRVQVVGLFPHAAVLNVDGQRKLVREGQQGPQGVRVIHVDGQGAVLEINGQRQRYPLTREHSAGYAATTEKAQTALTRGNDGHYRASGAINDRSIQFLVDTGASTVALNEATAKRLNISYNHGEPINVNTANGVTKGWLVTVARVSVGPITVQGVETVVLEGSSLSVPLLGMSFLNRVGWREDQGLLRLESRL